jgi:hypothetical protein
MNAGEPAHGAKGCTSFHAEQTVRVQSRYAHLRSKQAGGKEGGREGERQQQRSDIHCNRFWDCAESSGGLPDPGVSQPRLPKLCSASAPDSRRQARSRERPPDGSSLRPAGLASGRCRHEARKEVRAGTQAGEVVPAEAEGVDKVAGVQDGLHQVNLAHTAPMG